MSFVLNFASIMALDRVFNVLMDQQVESDSGPGSIRTITLMTVAANPFIAKQKLRVFVAILRPKRRIKNIDIAEIAQGIVLKTYSITVELEYLGQKNKSVG